MKIDIMEFNFRNSEFLFLFFVQMQSCQINEDVCSAHVDQGGNTNTESSNPGGEQRKAIQVVVHGIIDILADASPNLTSDHIYSLVKNKPEVWALIKQCQTSLVCLLLVNSDDTGRVDTKDAKKNMAEYKNIIERHHVPYIGLSHNDGKVDVLINAFKNYSMPLVTSNLITKKKTGRKRPPYSESEKENPTTNFLFNKPRRINDARISIRTINIKETEYDNDWIIIPKGRTNRFMTRYPSADDNLIQLYFHISVRSERVQNMLLNGVTVNGEKYSFLGCSSEGLKFRRCFMWKGMEDEVIAIIKENGDFDQNVVSKRMARFGLLFSEVLMTRIEINNEQIQTIEDIESDCRRYNFTDGCGWIDLHMAKRLTKEINNIDGIHLDENAPPSVFKIRLQGYKGVLALHKEIPGNTICVRPSMKKFATTSHPRLGVCDYSKQFTFGHLNQQYITLLSGLGVEDDVFHDLQISHFKQVQEMCSNPEAAIRILQWQKQSDLAESVMTTQKMDQLSESVLRRIKKVQANFSLRSEKLKILVPESRYIFGVCDPYGILEYGQCFVRITSKGDGLIDTISGAVVVCKTPCYLLGDVRVLQAISERENPKVSKLNHLADCIVFPVRGLRPHPNEIAGSDLDGDTFFVSWDERLIPRTMYPPYDYPSARSKPESSVTIPKMIMYFSNQNLAQTITRTVAKYFRYWCDTEGIKSEKCQQLGMLFSRVIDAAKTGAPTKIPETLQPNPTCMTPASTYTWQVMEERGKDFRLQFIKGFDSDAGNDFLGDISDDFVKDILEEHQSKLTEIEKFNFAWAHSNSLTNAEEDTCDVFMKKFVQFIDFSQFTTSQKRHLVYHGIHIDTMMNALSRSRLLSGSDLAWFSMDLSITPWKFYFRKENNELDWFYLTKALTGFNNTCLMIGIPDDVVIVLEFHDKCHVGLEQSITPGSISALFYSKKFGYRYRYIIGADYYLDLTDQILQIYRNKERSNTFVWLKETGLKRDTGFLLFGEIVNTLSVDLSRFHRNIYNNEKPHPLLNKAQLTRVEVFVENDDENITPYFDIMESYGEFPFEHEEQEECDDDENIVDPLSILSQRLTPFEDNLPLEGVQDYLQRAAEQCNIHDFKHLIIKLRDEDGMDKNIREYILDNIIVLLENIIQKTAPHEIPTEIRDCLDFCVYLEKLAKNIRTQIRLAELLTRLNMSDTATSFLYLDKLKDEITTRIFLDILKSWQLFWYLDISVGNQFIDGVTRMAVQNVALGSTESSEAELQDMRRKKYIFNFGRLHCLALIQEMDKLKVQLSKSSNQLLSPTGVQNLKIDSSKTGDILSLYSTSALSYIPKIYEGQYVTVARQIDIRQRTCYTSCCLIAQVLSVTHAPFRVELKIQGNVPDMIKRSIASKQTRFWRCDAIANLIMYERVLDAFQILGREVLKDSKIPLLSILTEPNCHAGNSLLCSEHAAQDILYERNTDKTLDLMSEDVRFKKGPFRSELNPKQELAVQMAISQIVTCIQGPPGTGKTTVACNIIRTIIKINKNKRFKKHKSALVVAETNNAIDNIARKLRNKVLFVRLGTTDGIAPDLYDVSLEGQVDRIAQLEARRSTFQDRNEQTKRNTVLYKDVLDKFDVVLTTCAGSGDKLLEMYSFDFVLVDEATYTTETTLLCSLVHGCKHLVMIGDPNQLSPYLAQPRARLPDNDLPDVTDLSQTLFHRLYKSDLCTRIQLNVQYRMHPELLKFPSDEFYDNQLISDDSTTHMPAVIFPWPNQSKPFCFINTNGIEKMKGSSYCNENEAKLVSDVVDILLNVKDTDMDLFSKSISPNVQKLSVKDITVLTFYQRQVATIKDTIKARVTVHTVDGYQGCENDVIVASTVRANKQGLLGFSEDRNRLNVLFTRAKRALIIIGNKDTLRTSETWRKWLNDSPEIGSKDIEISSDKKINFSWQYDKIYTKSVSGKKTRQKKKFTY